MTAPGRTVNPQIGQVGAFKHGHTQQGCREALNPSGTQGLLTITPEAGTGTENRLRTSGGQPQIRNVPQLHQAQAIWVEAWWFPLYQIRPVDCRVTALPPSPV